MGAHPKSVGDRAEAHVLVALLAVYDTVLLPWGENQRYDFVVEDAARGLLRIQVKSGRLRSGAIRFNTSSTTYHHPAGRRTKHAATDYRGDADLFAVHCDTTGGVYLVPVSDVGVREASLRVEPARNGQRTGIRFAQDYQIHPPG